MSEIPFYPYENDPPTAAVTIADLRAQLADTIRERNDAVARAEAAEAKLEKYAIVIEDPDVFRLRANHDAALARAEAAEAQTAYADDTVRLANEATDAWLARAEAAERVVDWARKVREASSVFASPRQTWLRECLRVSLEQHDAARKWGGT